MRIVKILIRLLKCPGGFESSKDAHVRRYAFWRFGLFDTNTVEPRYLELAYFELPLISQWKSGPCFNMKV